MGVRYGWKDALGPVPAQGGIGRRIKSIRPERIDEGGHAGSRGRCGHRRRDGWEEIEEEDILLVDVPESHARKLVRMDLSVAETEVLEELQAIPPQGRPLLGTLEAMKSVGPKDRTLK